MLKIVYGLSLVIFLISCNQPKVDIDYCSMLEEDQSYLSSEELDQRKKVFVENLETIVKEINENGFPDINPIGKPPKDSCKYWAINGTLIHISQTRPDLFYNEDHVSLFETEIKKGNLDPQVLYPAIKMGSSREFCSDMKSQIFGAIDRWTLDANDFELKFKECEI